MQIELREGNADAGRVQLQLDGPDDILFRLPKYSFIDQPRTAQLTLEAPSSRRTTAGSGFGTTAATLLRARSSTRRVSSMSAE